MPELRHIEVHPDRLSARPVSRGRRIAAYEVAEMATTPEGLRTLLHDYRLTNAEIKDAQQWWDAVRRFESAA